MFKRTGLAGISLLTVMLAVMFIPACSCADIYRCTSDDGVVKFSDEPCGEKYEMMANAPSIDQLIAQARPYKQPFLDPDRITSDLIACSQKIADGILPDEHYRTYHVYEDEKKTKFTIYLLYVPEGFKANNPNKYRIYEVKIKYQKRSKDRDYELWLISMSIKLGRSPFSPHTMERVKSLKKTGPAEWVPR